MSALVLSYLRAHLAAIAVASAALSSWALGLAPDQSEPVWRIVAAGVFVTIIPGYCLRRALRRRVRQPIEEIAHASALSLGIAAVIAAAVVAAGGSVRHFVGALFALSLATFSVGLARTCSRGPVPAGLPFTWPDGWIAALIGIFSVAAYRWASPVEGLDWEVGLQMIYVRQVASGLPTTLPEIWLRADIPLPNFFFLWEYLLGAIAAIAQTDALMAAARSRWLIPAIGIPAFFFWVRVVTNSTALARRVVAVVLALVATQFINIAPDPLARLNEQRPLFSFLGTVHHSDVALDLLLPLLLGHVWMCLRRPSAGRAGLLALLLFATFLIHPRELFQVAWYAALAGPVMLIAARGSRRRVLAGWLTVCLVIVVTAGAVGLAARVGPATRSAQADEWESKRALAGRLVDSATVYTEPLMRFYVHGTSPAPTNPPNTHGWLLLTAVSLPLLWWAAPRVSWIGPYFMALWWLTLSFGWSQMLLQVLTYSEITMTKVRFLPVFGFVVLALAIVGLVHAGRAIVPRRWRSTTAHAVGLCLAAAAGAGIAVAWPRIVTSAPALSAVSAYALLAAVGLCVRAYRPIARSARPAPSPGVLFIATLLLVAPAARVEAVAFWSAVLNKYEQPARAFEQGNAAGLSPAIIQALRRQVPARSRVTVDPDSSHMIGMYAPVYGVPIPRGQVFQESIYLGPPPGADRSLARDLRCADGRLTVPLVAGRVGASFMLLAGPCFDAWERLSDAERTAHPVLALDQPARQALVRAQP